MTFKEFMNTVFRLPANIFNGISTLLFGGYAPEKNGSLNKQKQFLGLFGLILEGGKKLLDFGKWLGRSLTSFFKNHEQAIASAFWLSLLIAGAAALTVAFWPAALAFVAGLSIAGYSIASLVGTGFAAQVAATAAVATLLTSAAVYTVAAVSNFINFVKACCIKEVVSANEAEFDADEASSTQVSASALSRLSTTAHKTSPTDGADQAPIHSASILSHESGDDLLEEEVAPLQGLSV